MKQNNFNINTILFLNIKNFLLNNCKPYIISNIWFNNNTKGSCQTSKSNIKSILLTRIQPTNHTVVIHLKGTNCYKFFIFLKKTIELQLNSLLDIWALDSWGKHGRFLLCYNLINYQLNFRVFIRIRLSHSTFLNTLTKLYPAAEWLEREVWEFFGIYFKHHSDLRRLLTDYGFEWFPLRKEFPIAGFCEIFYDEITKNLEWTSLNTLQGFRLLHFLDQW